MTLLATVIAIGVAICVVLFKKKGTKYFYSDIYNIILNLNVTVCTSNKVNQSKGLDITDNVSQSDQVSYHNNH